MDVTVIGAGNMGRGIGTRLVAGGNRVKILDNDPDQARELADDLKGSAAAGGAVEAGAAGDELTGDVVVLAVWYPDGMQSAAEQYADQLDGKVVVDISNPVDVDTFDGLVTPAESSAAEELAKKLPSGAKVVKAFNTTVAACRRAQPDRHRAAAPRPGARAPRVPAHGDPGRTGDRLRQRREGDLVRRRWHAGC